MDIEKAFFTFIYKRQLIWYKRFVLKEKPPWTKDPILKTFKIINMYRELDRCTIYILNTLKEVTNRKTLLLNIIFFRFFNQDKLYEKLSIQPFEKIESDFRASLLQSFENMKQKGQPLFNNAYLISSSQKGTPKHIQIIDILQKLDLEELVREIDNAKNPRAALEVIQTISMVGPFLACEIWTDLSYFHFFRRGWNDNDFVNIGPGAKWGLEIMYQKKMSPSELEGQLRHLHTLQKAILPKIHEELHKKLAWEAIAYKKPFSHYPFLSLTNIEGALCEFRKYSRLQQGKGKKRYFQHRNS